MKKKLCSLTFLLEHYSKLIFMYFMIAQVTILIFIVEKERETLMEQHCEFPMLCMRHMYYVGL